MSRINMQMSVLGLTKCHRVQTLFVISATITLVSSCCARAFPTPAPAVPSSQQLAAISPGLIITPLLQGRPGFGYSPKKLPLFTESLFTESLFTESPSRREGSFSETGLPPDTILGNPRDESALLLFSGSRYYDAHLKRQGTIFHERLPLCDDVALQCGATFVIHLRHRVRQWRALHVLTEKLLRCRET